MLRSGNLPEFHWSKLRVAAVEEFFDFIPVDGGAIEPEADPAARTDIGGHVELARAGFDQKSILAGEDLAPEAEDAVAVMIVEKVGEDLFANEKSNVIAFCLAGYGRQREADFSDSLETIGGSQQFGH